MAKRAGYADIARHFRAQIRDKTMHPGDRLPTVRQVMDEWGVSNATATRAYKLLKSEGLTESRAGSGTVVAQYGSDNVAARVRNFAETGRALSADETSQILEIGMVGADETVASRLEVEPGSPVLLRRRLVSRDGVPVHLSSSYYAPYVSELVPELSQSVSTGGSRELASQRLGAEQDYVLEEVTSRFATDPEKEALGLTGAYVIVTQALRTVYLTDGYAVEMAIKVCHSSTVLKSVMSLRQK